MSFAYTPSPARPGWIARAISWMDDRAPVSWIVAVIATFTFGGPLGLVMLGFTFFTGRLRFRSCRRTDQWSDRAPRVMMSRPTGNRAFDSYKADTIARLEREQDEFEAFLIRLREARDKAEFDQYMDERAKAAATPATTDAPEPAEPRA